MAKKYQSSLGEQKVFQHSTFVQHEEIKKNITIITELESLIPPLLDDELAQLEANIIKDGCREALLVWPTIEQILEPIDKSDSTKPIFVLIDGHNRYKICTKNNIDFTIHLVNYKTLEEIRGFMIDNQLGRRNLGTEQMSYLRGMKYIHLKQDKGKYSREEHIAQNDTYAIGGGNEHIAQNDTYGSKDKKVNTAELLATQFNVGQATIKRDAEFAEGLEKLTPNFKTQVLSGKSKINKKYIQQLSKKEISENKIDSTEELEQVLGSYSTDVEKQKTITNNSPEELIIEEINSLVKKLKNVDTRKELCEEIIRLIKRLS
jgi:hypothetical protein